MDSSLIFLYKFLLFLPILFCLSILIYLNFSNNLNRHPIPSIARVSTNRYEQIA